MRSSPGWRASAHWPASAWPPARSCCSPRRPAQGTTVAGLAAGAVLAVVPAVLARRRTTAGGGGAGRPPRARRHLPGGLIGAIVRLGLVEGLRRGRAVALGHVHRQHRRPSPGVLRDAAAGAPAAVGLPPAAARHRVLRRADDVLDHAARAAAMLDHGLRRPAAGYAAASVSRASSRSVTGIVRRVGWSREALVAIGVGLLGGAGAVRGSCSTGFRARAAQRVSVRHARGQPQRRARARGARRGRADGDAASPARHRAVGSYTTFCTWVFESDRLAEDGRRAVRGQPGRQPRGRRRDGGGRLQLGAALERRRLKLTTYFGERDRAGDRFLADALLDLYARHELRTSVVLRGVEGFGVKHHLHTDRLLTLSEDLPLVSVAVDRARASRRCSTRSWRCRPTA